MKLAPLALLLLLAPAAAAADPSVRALAVRPDTGGGPVLVDDRVVFARTGGDGVLRVLEAPVAGGAPAEIARVPVPGSRFDGLASWDLVASGDGLALSVQRGRSGMRLWAGPTHGPLALVQRRLTPGSLMAEDRDLFAVPGGPLVLERTDRLATRLRAVLRPPVAAPRRVVMPRGADLHHVGVAGGIAAVAVQRSREIAFVELASGAIVRRQPLGRFAGALLTGLAISAAGDVALTAEGDGGVDYVGWASVGSAAPQIVAIGDSFEHVAIAGGRIAYTRPAIRGEGERVVVLDPAGPRPRELFAGPPADHVRHLDFDGSHVAWSTGGCQLVARIEPPRIVRRTPAGPCVRTEASFGTYSDAEGSDPVRFAVRCLTAPGRRCRIDVRVFAHWRVARRVATVPVGRRRMVRVPLSPRVQRWRADGRNLLVLVYRVIDPDGRKRVNHVLPY